ncbi:hypothetical protein DFH07DRAFT_775197 [Mycena maculata]|uniref:Uncharacterized protein n=1 Tax=Mycena maculata TaxID=230809 RepID=A0AAD7IT93_9AGAR|nr:hypothetical protein DFH07DRAFT_775197 [Mycena maculata]
MLPMLNSRENRATRIFFRLFQLSSTQLNSCYHGRHAGYHVVPLPAAQRWQPYERVQPGFRLACTSPIRAQRHHRPGCHGKSTTSFWVGQGPNVQHPVHTPHPDTSECDPEHRHDDTVPKSRIIKVPLAQNKTDGGTGNVTSTVFMQFATQNWGQYTLAKQGPNKNVRQLERIRQGCEHAILAVQPIIHAKERLYPDIKLVKPTSGMARYLNRVSQHQTKQQNRFPKDPKSSVC